MTHDHDPDFTNLKLNGAQAMSDAETIAEVLREHAQVRGFRDMQVHCECGWTKASRTIDRARNHCAHQADMVAAALEPVIREAQAAAVRDSARYIERLAPKGLVSRDAVLADLEVAAGRIGRGRYANGTDPNPYDTKEEA